MALTARYYNTALSMIKDNREKQEILCNERLERLYQKYPILKNIDGEIQNLFSNATKQMLNGTRVDFDSISKKSLALQQQRAQFLESVGVAPEDLKPAYACPNCSDTGYVDGKMCDCVKKLAAKLIYDEINADVPLDRSTFELFDVTKYPEADDARETMQKIYQYCLKYAQQFSADSPNLLFYGKTGLGKTHLSLAIANVAIQKGYNVIYGPLSRIIGKIEAEHFSKENHENQTLQSVIGCDLLIIDDLGTEFSGQFAASVIYDIINSRILNGKPTIINTNLEISEIQDKYSDRVLSRISGNYKMFVFVGEDIRTL